MDEPIVEFLIWSLKHYLCIKSKQPCLHVYYGVIARLEDHLLQVTMQKGHMVVQVGGVQMEPSLKPVHFGKMVLLHMPDESQLHVGVGDTWIDVSRDIQPVHYFLNMQARSLATLGCKIGGLLGDDDHVDVSTLPSGCKKSSRVLTTVQHTPRVDASARMTP